MFDYISKYKIFSKKLCAAVSTDDRESLEKLLENVELCNARDSYGRTLMHIAAATGNECLLAQLINAGADKDARDLAGNTPFITAAFFVRDGIMRILYNAGADPFASNAAGYTGMSYLSHFTKVEFLNKCNNITNNEAQALSLYNKAQNACSTISPLFSRHWSELLCATAKKTIAISYINNQNPIVGSDLHYVEFLAMYDVSCHVSLRSACWSDQRWALSPLYLAALYFTRDYNISRIFFSTSDLYESPRNDRNAVMSPLHYAVMALNHYGLKMMLMRGADVTGFEIYSDVVLNSTILYDFGVTRQFLLGEMLLLLFVYGANVCVSSDTLENFFEQVHIELGSFEDFTYYMFNDSGLGNIIKQLIYAYSKENFKSMLHMQDNESFNTYCQACRDELLKQRECVIFRDITVYRLLSFDVEEMIWYTKYAIILRDRMEEVDKTFPLYSKYLKLKTQTMIELRDRVNCATDTLRRILPIDCYLIVDIIARCLSLNDLHMYEI